MYSNTVFVSLYNYCFYCSRLVPTLFITLSGKAQYPVEFNMVISVLLLSTKYKMVEKLYALEIFIYFIPLRKLTKDVQLVTFANNSMQLPL